ncbi:RNA polymerase II degradation factor 1-like isoform X2 [Anopheles albimanus]|uniref:Ribosome receptor lysine/proline rich domain-containing protein n=1 Tax=Anopheles albimanus TaxID=7167 RepID=A0A182F7G8_ANOAL|nr:RNA polymerase II degradation factor 1-like isoform X2 [Anopheles albimanus]
MDLTTFAIIVIVILVSFLSMLFISRFPKGKTFEEMVKEKREMREKILGLTSSSTSKSGKESTNKKTKKSNSASSAQKNRSAKQQQQHQQQRVEIVEHETDGNSSESALEEEINPLTYGAKKRTGLATNLTVEYAETEAFPLSDSATSNKKKNKQQQQQHQQQQQQQQQGGKKHVQKGSGGILVNKAEPVLVKPVESVPEMNHFAEIHPKDALEIARQQKQEEEAKAQKQHQQPKEQRQSKHKKENNSKLSPKPNGIEQQQQQQQQLQLQNAHAVPVVVEMKKHHHSDSKAASAVPVTQKDKSTKKKRNELLSQEHLTELTDSVNVQTLVNILSTAELPRNDIQILIDFLLNKQQDTLAKDPSEWNDPSDPLQKLKRQLQEKETALLEEQQAAAGLQAKLKELRQELNAEKVHTSAVLKSYVEELNNRKQEVQQLTQELHTIKEKTANEKHTLSIQFQQLQAKYIQLSKEHAANQDHGATIAQLNNDLQLLQQELMAKSQLLNEKLQSEEDMIKKKTEYEILLRSNDELMRQRVQELAAYENELRQLRMQVSQKDELDKSYQQQNYAIEQLKAELQAKQKDAANAAAASNQADEMNRVEIRNLQNALDSTKSKLEVYRNELVDCKSLLTDYKQQADELKAKEEQLLKQIEEQRQRNDEQQQKLVAASNVEKVDVGKIVHEEQTRTKDLLVKLLQPTGVVSALPVDATDFQSWLEATVDCIKEQHERLLQSHATSNSSSSSNINSSSTASQTTTTNTTTTGTSTGTSSRSDNGDSTLIANNILNNPRSIANNNSLQKSNSNDTGVVVDSNKNGAAGPAATATDSSGEEDEQQNLALRNEQLQKTLDQYKIIIADTEIILKNLETKVIEQDIHWRSVVQAKEKELTLLKSAGAVQ